MTELGDVPQSSADAVAGRHRSNVSDRRPDRDISSAFEGGATRLIAVVVGAVVAAGFVLRLLAAMVLSPHVDEPSSLLAAHAVADRGLPILPSGTVYLQGGTLSYLLVPFVWLGRGELQDLHLMRIVVVLAGTAAIVLSFRLGLAITGDARVGAIMAALVAFDPLSAQWSGHLRMYGLLQALTVALAWAYVLLLTRGPSSRRVALVVLLFWAAVFTHVGAALLGPAMALAAAIIYRRSLLKQGWLLATLALSALAPLTLLGLNNVLGTASVAPRVQEEAASNPLTFVGDNLLTPFAWLLTSPSEWGWGSLVHPSNLFWLIPGLIVAVSTLHGGRLLLRRTGMHEPSLIRNGTVTLLAFYWVPMIGIGLFTMSPKERYLLNVHALGYFFLAFLIVRLTSRIAEGRHGKARLAAHGVTVLVVLALGSGLVWRLENPIVHPNHNAAMEYVVERHESGQPVIVALPPVAWLALEEADRDDLSFLAGPQDQARAHRYTRWNANGELIDYWVGTDAIVSTDELRAVLLEQPDAWVVVDDHRLTSGKIFGGSTERVLRDLTVPVYDGPGGVMVLRPASSAADGTP